MATSIDQTAICPFPRYRSKHIAENSQWISLTANSFTALLTKREQARFREFVNTCTERRVEKRVQRTAWILSHVLRTTLCEHVNGLCPAGWLSEQSITKHCFQSVRTCSYSWATDRNNTKHQQKSDKLCFVGGHSLFAFILTALLLPGKTIAYFFIQNCFDYYYWLWPFQYCCIRQYTNNFVTKECAVFGN